ncbi:POT family proton-dependent oligopeptide transporter [Archangium gephyra]|uniref:Di-/tripeptide transporter n=1 Tax=Archangium gephyra TaxID=48 RepID=A0AAC8TGW4_9BACT|nr:peptide MFS transporter [Archangium gephyra]AKJ05548.1 Di-/tripeptide transporter [Archangium gephyra]REG36231.1 POT family proton-dependent oligopeptide transporter [Archangium gephyra]
MAQSTAAAAPARGHPKGLYLLFTTEMWERMSYYGMRALLVLYMVGATDKGGFGWTQSKALQIYGLYTGLVYATPVIGGYLADRFLGQRLSVTLGGILMMMGQFVLAMPGNAEPLFYAGLGLLVVGNGFFKPNISTMVGGLYEPGDPRRDGAFTIFYIGINVGAFLASAVCGTLGEKFGWMYGFGSAGVGMGLGVLVFLAFAKRLLGNVGTAPKRVERKADVAEAPVQALTRQEVDRVIVILVLALFVVFFWAAFEQAGGLMNLYTDAKVDRNVFGFEVPTTWMQAVNPLFIMLLGPIFAEMWTGLGRKSKDPSIPAKMAMGLLLLSFGFVFMLGASKQSEAAGKAALMWVVAAYFFHTAGELCLSPVGLSMVTKLAPTRFASLLMGVWFIANAVANYLAGLIGGFAEKLGEFDLFLAITVATAVAGVVLLAISPFLKRMMHGADETKPMASEHPAPTSEPKTQVA